MRVECQYCERVLVRGIRCRVKPGRGQIHDVRGRGVEMNVAPARDEKNGDGLCQTDRRTPVANGETMTLAQE